MKNVFISRYYLPFFDGKSLEEIKNTLERNHPEHENFRFQITVSLFGFEVLVFGDKKEKL